MELKIIALIAIVIALLTFLVTRHQLVVFLIRMIPFFCYFLIAGSIAYFVISTLFFFPINLHIKVYKPTYGYYEIDSVKVSSTHTTVNGSRTITISSPPRITQESEMFTSIQNRYNIKVVDTLVPEDDPPSDIKINNPLYWHVHNIDLESKREYRSYNASQDPMSFAKDNLYRVLSDTSFKAADQDEQFSILSRFFDLRIVNILNEENVTMNNEIKRIKDKWIKETYEEKVLGEKKPKKLVPQKTIEENFPDYNKLNNRIWCTIVIIMVGIITLEIYKAVNRRKKGLSNNNNG